MNTQLNIQSVIATKLYEKADEVFNLALENGIRLEPKEYRFLEFKNFYREGNIFYFEEMTEADLTVAANWIASIQTKIKTQIQTPH